MKTVTLYELTEQYQQLAAAAESAIDEEDVKAFADTLEGLDGEIKQKIDGCAAVVRQLDAKVAAIKAESERMLARAKSVQASRERLIAYMEVCLNLAKLRKVQGDRFTVYLQANPPKVEIDPALSIDRLPAECVRTKREPDKTKIGELLAAGTAVPGCSIVRTDGLRIR